ncbi:uncharacterized protein LOC131614252 [Vicia villosa]|uniref:uncharacterized protein LOC131614252 n=1 Tax=Vicia villosa TaxID=3911 RepID=UPI00273ABFFE|nr:uncharacterized protein LOC131614252 [Vicia villosa]
MRVRDEFDEMKKLSGYYLFLEKKDVVQLMGMGGFDSGGLDGRNDAAFAAALQVVAQAVQNQLNIGGNDESHNLGTFQRENPPTFKGKYDSDGAQGWLKEIESIFHVMDCSEGQNVRYDTHMLDEEADDWWLSTCQRLKTTGEVITWAVFCREFLRKYFPEDVREKNEIEFLELKQGNLTVTQ